MDGQVSGLGTVHPLLTLSFFSTWILPLHVVFNIEEEVVFIRNGWTPKNEKEICLLKLLHMFTNVTVYVY